MEPEKTTAIVIRVIEFSETSCVVTMFTRSLGKITALAKGARRPKGPFESAIDLLALCRIVFLHKTSDALDLLTEAKLERRFRSANRDLDRLNGGYYIAELLRLLTDDADPHPELFDLAELTLAAIDDDGNLRAVLTRFEAQMLRILGHAPMLSRCSVCGKDKTEFEQVQFGLNDGGLICKPCSAGKSGLIMLRPGALQMLSDVFDSSEVASNGDDGIFSPAESLSNHPDYRAVRNLMNQYLCHLVGYPIRLQKLIDNI